MLFSALFFFGLSVLGAEAQKLVPTTQRTAATTRRTAATTQIVARTAPLHNQGGTRFEFLIKSLVYPKKLADAKVGIRFLHTFFTLTPAA